MLDRKITKTREGSGISDIWIRLEFFSVIL